MSDGTVSGAMRAKRESHEYDTSKAAYEGLSTHQLQTVVDSYEGRQKWILTNDPQFRADEAARHQAAVDVLRERKSKQR